MSLLVLEGQCVLGLGCLGLGLIGLVCFAIPGCSGVPGLGLACCVSELLGTF